MTQLFVEGEAILFKALLYSSDGHEPIFWGSGRVEPDTIWLEPGRAGP